METRGGSRGVARVSELHPFDGAVSRRARATGGRRTRNQRFLERTTAKVAISQAIHQTVAERVKLLGCSALGDASPAAAALVVGGHRYVGRAAKR